MAIDDYIKRGKELFMTDSKYVPFIYQRRHTLGYDFYVDMIATFDSFLVKPELVITQFHYFIVLGICNIQSLLKHCRRKECFVFP